MVEKAYLLRDAALIGTKALPNGAAAVNSDGFDLESPLLVTDIHDDLLADVELMISGPALTTAELPDAQTMKYDVQCDSAVDFSVGPKTLAKEVLIQTGAGAAGAAAATARFRLPTDCERYIRVVATNSGAGDASGKELTEELLF